MLKVANIQLQGLKATISIEGDSFAEVASTDAKRAAIDAGTEKLGLCGISGASGPYPVDEKGQEISDAAVLEALSGKGQTWKYRNDYSITQSLAL